MNAQVLGQFGMKRASPTSPFAYEYGLAVDAGENLDARSNIDQARRTNEDAFQPGPFSARTARSRAVRVGARIGRCNRLVHERHERIELGAVGVSLGFDVDQPERRNRMIV